MLALGCVLQRVIVRADSLAHAAALCPADGDAWVIGGAEIYAQALLLATTAVVTDRA